MNFSRLLKKNSKCFSPPPLAALHRWGLTCDKSQRARVSMQRSSPRIISKREPPLPHPMYSRGIGGCSKNSTGLDPGVVKALTPSHTLSLAGGACCMGWSCTRGKLI